MTTFQILSTITLISATLLLFLTVSIIGTCNQKLGKTQRIVMNVLNTICILGSISLLVYYSFAHLF